ncbi:MAG: signal peptidase I [Planctomycetaceae bacterium]|nr:signal peptidase I [Planctomycetaceae bacterium]
MKRTYAKRHDEVGPTAKPGASRAKDTPKEKEKDKEGYRETVEAIVVAFILALLVRGFEAEAFVIPTGSMAPTLMGRHKEITCPQCGYVYSVNASVEDAGSRNPQPTQVVAGTCVNCRFTAAVSDAPTFNGDRILVMKFLYDLPFLPGAKGGPRRWDVVVFRYPEEPEVSYIKRLVGLPGETIRIWSGDIYVKSPGGQEFHLERKPLRHQAAMEMMVYDDRHRAESLKDRPEWRRWSASTPGSWTEEPSGTYSVAAAPGTEAELRYRHLLPDPEQWDAIVNGRALPWAPRPTLITDFYSYNSNITGNLHLDRDGWWMQPHWVGDLSLSATLRIKEARGVVRFELIEGGVANRCEIDLASGVATLKHGSGTLGRSSSGISGPGSHAIHFANIDDRLTLLVDGRAVFGDGLPYGDGRAPRPLPTRADLAPAAVTAIGAEIAVSDLVLKRDIYYTNTPGNSDYGNLWTGHDPRSPVELFDHLADPAKLAFLINLPWKDYSIAPDRYMMLGDNSPMSKDSRGWGIADRASGDDPDYGWDPSGRKSWEVPRALLTGKAFFVYWPHGKPFGPDIRLGRDLRIPFRPYIERMKWIR